MGMVRVPAVKGASLVKKAVVFDLFETLITEWGHEKYTKRMLKVKPHDAIQEDCIYCCICGDKRSVLTAAHMSNHDITVDEYRKLCGYDPK